MGAFNNRVLLDSNFIISLQVTRHQFFTRAQELIYEFKENGVQPVIIPLVFDEFWYILKGYFKTDFSSATKDELSKMLTRSTKKVLAIERLLVADVGYKEKDLLGTLKIMSKYDLRPRDAMIVKSMQILGIDDIASFDSDFDRVKGINVIK